MATRATIVCKNCNNSFYLFNHEFDADKEIVCPYCLKSLDKSHNSSIQHLLRYLSSTNATIRSAHRSGDSNLFEINLEEVFVPNELFNFGAGNIDIVDLED